MARLSKEERLKRKKQWQAANHGDLVDSMPMTPEQLDALLNHLDTNLESCDHTATLTAVHLRDTGLDVQRVLAWLAEQGGFCDCEVLNNLANLADSLTDQPPPLPKPKRQIAPRLLANPPAWNLRELPKPWRIANPHAPDEPLQLQMGKKGGCTLTIVESALPPGDPKTDEYWAQLWYARTELPERGPSRVTREPLKLPRHLRSTLVESANWTPVFCWIVPNEETWYVEFRTESNRQQGDLVQIAKLITHLESQ
jgi:hypothetical protein